MTLPDDQTSFSSGRAIVLVLLCVAALALPFLLLARQPSSGTEDQQRLAGTSTSATTGSTRTSGAPTAAPPARATAAVSPGTTDPSARSLATAAESCRLANLRHRAPLSAAEVSLAQFDKHIDAMNLLVAGKISLSVATTFWDQTRVKAVENAAAFRRADQELRGSGTSCAAPDASVANPAPYGQVVAIMSCVRAVSAADTTLAKARKAVSTWEHHVHDMEMLRMGDITPAQATAAWQKNWKTGQKQLKAYEAAAAAASKITCTLD